VRRELQQRGASGKARVPRARADGVWAQLHGPARRHERPAPERNLQRAVGRPDARGAGAKRGDARVGQRSAARAPGVAQARVWTTSAVGGSVERQHDRAEVLREGGGREARRVSRRDGRRERAAADGRAAQRYREGAHSARLLGSQVEWQHGAQRRERCERKSAAGGARAVRRGRRQAERGAGRGARTARPRR
jgi:hypothetical protein